MIRKLFVFLVSIFLLSAAVFYVSRLAPGDPLISYYGDRAEKMNPQERQRAQERLGLNEPVFVQYICWLKNALRGNFGISYKYKQDVLEVIGRRLPNTLLLGGGAFVLIFLLAPGPALLCARHEDGLTDRFLCKAGTIISCIPEFWLALVLILIFAVKLHWLPFGGAYSAGNGSDPADRALHLLLPLSAAVLSHLWYYAYMIRNRLLEEIRSEYVLLAKSKGLSGTSILLRHCLRNVLCSYLSIMAISVPHILGGTYVIEIVFSYPGLGTLAYESARFKDYNLLMILCILSGAAVMLCSMAAQALSGRIDPRIRTVRGLGEGKHG